MLFLIALSVTFLLFPLHLVSAANVSIISFNPSSQSGYVGDPIQIFGSLETISGAYEIWFGTTLVASGKATGDSVLASFNVPTVPGGDYAVTLKDVAKNVNATTTYTLSSHFFLNAVVPPSPKQIQDGGSVVLNITLTGGVVGVEYSANLTVTPPTPLSETYSQEVKLTGSQTGTAHVDITYPSSSFQPAGANTIFTGMYAAVLETTETTELLARDKFFIGLTDSSIYHKQDSVSIHALGYQPSENSTLTINYTATGTVAFSGMVTATSEGIINYNWVVPDDSLIGDYNLTITPQTTPKAIVDSQTFTVPGYLIQFRTLNLAGNVVPRVSLEALDRAANALYNGTSGDDGAATINLERGSHTIDAFWNDVQVGELNVTITTTGSYDFACRLTTLKITVQDKNGLLIPFVSTNISYQYVTTKTGTLKTGQTFGQTDLLGAFSFISALPGIDYSIKASIYGYTFSTIAVNDLPAQPVFQAVILCPTQNLAFKILDSTLASLPNVRIVLVEQTSGIFYGTVTGTDGTVALDVTIGKYRVRVYSNDILLSDTVIEVFSDMQSEIRCALYNIDVSVKVVDYFGQSIPNVNVVLNGPSTETFSKVTPADGTATFNHVIGGGMQVVAYPQGSSNSYIAVNIQVEAATTLTVKMAKYVVVGPFLIETSVFATLVIIIIAILLFLSIEVYRRRRAKPSSKKVE